MNLLFVCHRIPYPPNKGEKIRAFNEIKYLSARHHLYLAFLVDDPDDLRHLDELRGYCAALDFVVIDPRWQKCKALPALLNGRPLSLPYFYSSQLQQAVDRRLEQHAIDAVICFSSPMAEYILRSRSLRAARRPRLIMDFVDVDSDKWGQYATTSSFPMNFVYRREQRRLLAYERDVNLKFDHSLLVTAAEAALFRKLVPAASNLQVVGNGVDYEYFAPDLQETGQGGEHLLFTGAMDYHANVDAVTWFCSEVLPQLRNAGVTGDFCIVGSKPAAAVRELGRIPGVRVTGFVEDIRFWYSRAAVSVIPLRLGRGVQNKLLEAMAMGKPVVTTSKVAESVGAKADCHLIVADSAKDFAGAVLALWREPAVRRDLGREARNFVVAHFDWQRNMEKLDGLLASPR